MKTFTILLAILVMTINLRLNHDLIPNLPVIINICSKIFMKKMKP